MHGRDLEIALLEKSYKEDKSNLIALYGRRRIGKSYLLKTYCKTKKSVFIEGLENVDTPGQIINFQKEFYKQTNAPLLKNSPFTEWSEIFDFLSDYVEKQNEKIVIVFDELQWMSAGKTALISLLKMYWDQHLLPSNKVQFILCGSIASFMINQVIHGKALYGRIDLELQIKELSPYFARKIISGPISDTDFFHWYLTIGGVPKYYTLINPSMSYIKNMEALFFTDSGYLFNEMDKIFYSQFKEAKTYEKIIKSLQNNIKTSDQLSKDLKFPSGGGFLRYLDILEKARFIFGYKQFEAEKSRIKKYKAADEYLRFYIKFVSPFKKIILNGSRKNIFKDEIALKWTSWLGYAFEHFCLKQNAIISKILDIDDKIIDYGPLFKTSENHFQIDLMFKTNEKEIYICECKYTNEPIQGDVIADMQKKLLLYKAPKGYAVRKVLISTAGATKAVHASKYFDHIIDLEQILKN
jgi:uncharacterized protein